MSEILHIHKRAISSNNRIVIKNIYKRQEYPLMLKEIQVIIETPSGEYWRQGVKEDTPFLYILRNGNLKKFSISDLVYIYNGELYFFRDYRIILIKPCTSIPFDFSRIRKLTINNQYIKEVNLDKLDLEYLDIRNNFLDTVTYKNKLKYCDMRDNTIKRHNIRSDILLEDKPVHNYIFKSRSLHITNYNSTYAKYKIYNISYRFYIVQRDIPDFIFLMNCILRNIPNTNLIDIIEDIYYKLKKMCLIKGEFYIVCITEEEIIIKLYKTRVVMDYFLRREIIWKEHTYVFDNIGKYYIHPIISSKDNSEDINKDIKKVDIKDNKEDNNKDIKNDNNKDIKKDNKEVDIKKDIKEVDYDFTVVITNQGNTHITSNKLIRKCKILDPHTILKKYNKKKKITKDKKIVFMFIKFYETKSNSKSNLKKQESLLKRLKNINTCKVIEDNGTDGIIFMSQDLNSVLDLSLYIKKVFMVYKIDLSIGIACGQYFFKMDDKRCKFMGNVLNTASRMSYLGKGVYCCECAVVESDRVHFQYVGEREVRGYNKCIKTYLVCTKP